MFNEDLGQCACLCAATGNRFSVLFEFEFVDKIIFFGLNEYYIINVTQG